MRYLKLFSCLVILSLAVSFGFADVFDLSKEKAVYDAGEKFGLKVFKELALSDVGKNIMISPNSLFLTFSLLYNGVSGETKSELEKLLEFESVDLGDVNQILDRTIRSYEKTGKKVKIHTASTVLINDKLEFEEKFRIVGEKYYHAELDSIDFQSSKDFTRINKWAKKQTDGKIAKILSGPLPADTTMFVMNALYFNGRWKEQFKESETQEKDFHVTRDKTTRVMMMRKSGEKFPYYKGENFQAVGLPYGDGRFSMYIFLPNEEYSLKQLTEDLTFENWRTWMEGFQVLKGDVEIPRFTMDFDITLSDTLKKLGLEKSFDQIEADFSGITLPEEGARPFLDQVCQKNYIEVNEKGTIAISLTFIMLGGMAVADDFNFVADRPFMFTIYDNQTRSILFMGNVYNPAALHN